ncbi:MAG: hypothetical protein H0V66_01970 [Bdellovibrionales bacterium]|nr:hypothetical protein [Bdellovibrionales bacterium]
MDSKTFFHLDEDNKSVCTRCGKLKFMSFSQNNFVANDSSSKMIYQNYNYINNRQEIKADHRVLH